VAQKKEEKDAAKKQSKRKFLKHEAWNKRRRQQRLEGIPVEESPSEMASEEEDDGDSEDDDAGSRYDTVTTLAHLPDVQSLQEPVDGGSTSRASRATSTPVEGSEERVEGRAY
jgi:hypothetical protein